MANFMSNFMPGEWDLMNKTPDIMPTDDASAQLMLKRRLAQADLLKGMEAPQGQMVSGHYVAPSWTQYLANIVNRYQGKQAEQQAIQDYSQQQQTKQAKYAELLGQTEPSKFQQALAQMPEFQQDLVKAKLAAQNKEDVGQIIPAGATYYKGGQALYTAPTKQEKIFGTVNPSDFTPESMAKFAQTGKYEDLVKHPQTITPYQAEELALRRKELATKAISNFDNTTVDMLADQALAGDKSVFSGRGMTGANIAAVRNRMNDKMQQMGWSGRDIAAQNADFMANVAANRTAAVKGANIELAGNEFTNIAPLAKQAGQQVSRSGLLPFGKVQVMFNEQTNDPNMAQFAAYNNGLINTYARAISPTGVPSVSDKNHARELLLTAKDQTAYNATVDALVREIEAAKRSPTETRGALRGNITGRGNAGMPSQDAIAAELARRKQSQEGR